MAHNRTNSSSNAGRAALIMAVAFAAAAVAVHAAGPDLAVGPDRFPGADGIYPRIEQHWTLDADGTVHRRDHRWFKYFNSRPIRALADPRLDYNLSQDELVIHTAQTHLPDGSVLPIPKYSFNVVGPDDVAGWPAYADWRQMVVSYSGIEDGAVTELDYEVVTRPGVVPYLSTDVCLHEDYPVLERIVHVTVPAGVKLGHRVDQLPGQPRTESGKDGATTYSWTFTNLPGAHAEPQSPPWQERCGRLRASTCRDVADWTSVYLEPAQHAVDVDDAIRAFAEGAVENETNTRARIELVQKKLHDSFNFVHSDKTRLPVVCRPAPDVLHSNYGNDLEAAAVLASGLQAIGLAAEPVLALDTLGTDDTVMTDSVFAGAVVAVELAGDTLYVHPERGLVHLPGDFGPARLIQLHKTVAATGGLKGATRAVKNIYVPERGEQMISRLEITGGIELDEKDAATGELRFRLTGAYYDPAHLESAGAQKKLVAGLVGRVLTGFTVESYSVAELSDDQLRATAKVAAKDLPKLAGRRLIELGDGPAFLASFPLPLSRSYRHMDVDLRGAFAEHVDITIALPEGAEVAALPAGLGQVTGGWGSVAQQVSVDDPVIRLRRDILVGQDRLSPAEFDELRPAINDLRAAGSRLLAVGKADGADSAEE